MEWVLDPIGLRDPNSDNGILTPVMANVPSHAATMQRRQNTHSFRASKNDRYKGLRIIRSGSAASLLETSIIMEVNEFNKLK